MPAPTGDLFRGFCAVAAAEIFGTDELEGEGEPGTRADGTTERKAYSFFTDGGRRASSLGCWAASAICLAYCGHPFATVRHSIVVR